ncbi:MAG: DoxX family protein [Candidatus Rokuibacteriota bacterium]
MAQPCADDRAASGLRHLRESTIECLEGVPLSIHLLLFRLAIASVFLPAGFLKLAGWESTIALFQDEYKIPVLPPALAATMAASFEVGCSSLLIAGLATRFATLPLLGQILTIQLFVYPQAWHEHLVWGGILLFLLTRGAGAVSLDHLVSRWLNGPRA